MTAKRKMSVPKDNPVFGRVAKKSLKSQNRGYTWEKGLIVKVSSTTHRSKELLLKNQNL